MSLSATRNRRDRKYIRPLTIAQEMVDRGIEWRNGELTLIADRPWEITQEEVSWLQNTPYHLNWEALRASIMEGKSYGAEWIANRIMQNRGGSETSLWTLAEATEQLRLIRRINRSCSGSGIKWGAGNAKIHNRS